MISPADTRPLVALVGCGVVGRAILAELVRAGCNVLLCDLQPSALQTACNQLTRDRAAADLPALSIGPSAITIPLDGMQAISIRHSAGNAATDNTAAVDLLIESISENLQHKQQLFVAARQAFGTECVLASNTSNLSIAAIFDPLQNDPRALGMHFFMPVQDRPLVELIPLPHTASATLQRCRSLVQRLEKQPLVVADSPGFVVNRLLAPYLNQALLLLGLGVTDGQLTEAATAFGMPLSPLELIDRIGMRTAFDSGRVFWRHFPQRVDPAPILPGMIKAKRLGRDFGGGFYDYDAHGNRSPELNATASSVIGKYHRQSLTWSETMLLQALTIPMAIEAAALLASGLVDSGATIQQAVSGGLGYRRPGGFWDFFDQQGSAAILATSRQTSVHPGALLPDWLAERLSAGQSPSLAMAGVGLNRQHGEQPGP